MLPPNAVISIRDKEQLVAAVRTARSSWTTFTPQLDSFLAELRDVPAVLPAEVPEDVVTMDSRFVVRDVRANTPATFTLVFPDEADPDRGKVSVLSPAGMCLLGARVGQSVRWYADGNLRAVTVERLAFQPEHAARLQAKADARTAATAVAAR